MFKWLNKQGVESEEGFVVQVTSRSTIEYREGDKKIVVYIEFGIKHGQNCVIITPDAFEKWEDGTYIMRAKQKEILANFMSAMNFQDIVVLIY